MTLAAIQPTLAAAPPRASSQIPVLPGASFAEQLRAAGRSGEVDDVQEAAQQFVASAFIEPMLAIARETSEGEGPFAPGEAERRFAPLLDQHLADNVVKSANFALVDRVSEHLLRAVAQLPGQGMGAADVIE